VPVPTLALRAAAELELRERARAGVAVPEARALEGDWEAWLRALFAPYVSDTAGRPIPFVQRHRDLWDWAWALRRGERRPPFVAVWPRGSGKSTSVELALAAIAARRTRRYALYCCRTQDQADDHVQNVAGLLESSRFGAAYPAVADRLVGKYGHSKGWRRNRVRTSSGFTVDGLGLDVAVRGVKLDEMRPDLIVLDDVDDTLDSERLIERNVAVITRRLLPAGSTDCSVLAVQNLVHPDGVFAQVVDGRADFLKERILSGPFPAIEGLATEQGPDGRFRIVAGTPTWEGQDLARCQSLIDDIGLSAFRRECQHEVEAPSGGMFDHLVYRRCRHDEVPPLRRVTVWVDPAISYTDESDACGVQVDGLADDGTIYRLFSWEQRATPQAAMQVAIHRAIEYGARSVGVETDQGGDTWRDTYRVALDVLEAEKRRTHALAQEHYPAQERTAYEPPRWPKFESAKAGAIGSKEHRASLMLADYEKGRIVHVTGTTHLLEEGLRRFPRSKPFDLVDAAFWSWHALRTARAPRVWSVDDDD
jgi:hypothetical protein